MGATSFWLMRLAQTPKEKREIDAWWTKRVAKSKATGRYPEWKPQRPKPKWKRK